MEDSKDHQGETLDHQDKLLNKVSQFNQNSPTASDGSCWDKSWVKFTGGDIVALIIYQMPAYLGIRKGLWPKVSDVDICYKCLTGPPVAFVHPRQGNCAVTKAAEFMRRDIRFAVPEWIENTDQGGSLPREVVQI